MQAHTVDRLVVEKPHYPRLVLPPEMVSLYPSASALSPDGEVVAVPFFKGSLAFPYLMDNYVYTGVDIAVPRVEPFEILGVAGPEPRSVPIGFAVDHRRGAVTVLVYGKGGWERLQLEAKRQP